MPASAAQTQFAAEFALFLVVLAGLALVALRPELLTAGRAARAALAAGFLALGVSAFLHGSLLVEGANHPVIVALRAAGLAGLIVGGRRWRPTGISRQLFWAAVGVLAVALAATLAGAASLAAGTRALGALVLGAALLVGSRRSIAARVAASAAATLLLVVLVLSVALSAVVASTVREEFLLRLDARASAEATAIENTSVDAIEKARLTAAALAVRGEELTKVAQTGGPSLVLDLDLKRISDSFVSNLALAYITETGRVVSSARLAPETFVPIAAGPVVSSAISARAERASIEAIDHHALALGVAPVVGLGPGGRVQALGAVVAAAVLDDAYLQRRANDDPALSLALFTRGGPVARFGPVPDASIGSTVAEQVLSRGTAIRSVAGGRFLAGRAVDGPDGRPVLALVASTPTTLVDETRESLFRTLFLIALGGTFLALLLASIVGDRISSGLRRLTTAAEAIQVGELGVRAGIRSEDEVGVLSAAFDSMVDSIEEKTAALRRAADDETRLRNRLEAIVAGMGEALVAVDALGRVTEFNQAAEELLGVTASEVRGRHIAEVLVARGDDGSDLAARLGGPAPQRWSTLATVRDAGGADVPVALSTGALRGPRSEVAGAVVVLRDLRREREVERMKTEFLSRVGHELRTPVTKIMAPAQLLASRAVPPERAREFHQSIYESAKELARIVEMLEFFASLGAGREILRPEPVHPRDLLADVAARRGAQPGDGHVIRQHVARDLPDILADRRWLTLSIDELVDNAVKFSPQGGRISLAAALVDNGKGPTVEISVADKGIGMAPEELERVFAEWTQGDESDTRTFGGLGLGLALVKRVAESHGGTVTCVTAPGKGSKFSILLPPLQQPSEGSAAAPTAPRRSRRRSGLSA